MDYLIDTTPKDYRKADGYFEKGRIHWERFYKTGDIEELKIAKVSWSKIGNYNTSENQFLNKNTYDQISQYLRNLGFPGSTNFQISKENINNLLSTKMAGHLEKKRRREERLLWQKQ